MQDDRHPVNVYTVRYVGQRVLTARSGLTSILTLSEYLSSVARRRWTLHTNAPSNGCVRHRLSAAEAGVIRTNGGDEMTGGCSCVLMSTILS